MDTTMIKPLTITGDKKLAAQFQKMADEQAMKRVRQRLFYAGELVADHAKGLIMTGSASSGRHVPSRPGEPPKNDTGVLHNNIEVTEPAPLVVEVRSEAPYSEALETGTSKMAARPFMGPSIDAKRDEVVSIINNAMAQAIKRATQ